MTRKVLTRKVLTRKGLDRKVQLAVSLLAAVSLVALAGCSSGSGGGASGSPGGGAKSQSLKIVYEKTDSFTALDTLFQKVKTEFEASHAGVSVDLQPIAADDADYSTKVALSQRSPETAPDVFYEDTFRLRADAEAGYLLNLDQYLDKWDDWSQFNDSAKAAGQGDDGSIYAVPLGTDTRVIWYSKPVLDKAGISLPWQPKTWDDILTTARTIQKAEPDAVPFSMYAGKGTGEGTVMQSYWELLYGTANGAKALYNSDENKWVIGSQGFKDSLTFLKTLYDEKLAVSPADALDANVWKKVVGDLFPKGGIGGTVEGSYAPSFWQKGGPYEWAGYTKDVGAATFPTQNGQAPGGVSMSGGWTLAVGANTKDPQLAFDFLALALNKENALWYDINNSQIAVRDDVAKDASYLAANPFVKVVTDVVAVTHFRPATADYPKISTAAQEATEAVITGAQSVEEAAAAYDKAVTGIVGADKVVQG